MKKNKIVLAVFSFFVSLSTAFLVTSNNIIFRILNTIGLKDETFHKYVITAVITLLATVIKILWEEILLKIKPMSFSLALCERLDKGNGERISKKVNKKIEFSLEEEEFEDKELNFKLSFSPNNRLYLKLLKILELKLNIYFEPSVLDVQFLEWDNKESSFSINNRKIEITVFKQARVDGRNFLKQPYIIQENIILKPVRIKEDVSHLDFYFTTERFKWLTHFIIRSMKINDKYIVVINA